MRDGSVVAEKPTSEWNEAMLVTAMLARDLQHAYPWRDRPRGARPGDRTDRCPGGTSCQCYSARRRNRRFDRARRSGPHRAHESHRRRPHRHRRLRQRQRPAPQARQHRQRPRPGSHLCPGGPQAGRPGSGRNVQDNLVFGCTPPCPAWVCSVHGPWKHATEQISRFGIKTDSCGSRSVALGRQPAKGDPLASLGEQSKSSSWTTPLGESMSAPRPRFTSRSSTWLPREPP